MAQYAGKAGSLYLSTSGSGAASAVLKVSSWTLDMSTDKYETTGMGDTNKTYVQGLRDIQGSFEAFWDDGESKPFTGASSSDGVKAYLYPASNAPSKYCYGPAWIDASISVDVNGVVKVSGKIAANGAWGINL